MVGASYCSHVPKGYILKYTLMLEKSREVIYKDGNLGNVLKKSQRVRTEGKNPVIGFGYFPDE